MVHSLNAAVLKLHFGKTLLFLVSLHLFLHTLTMCYHSSLRIFSITDKAGTRSFHPGKPEWKLVDHH